MFDPALISVAKAIAKAEGVDPVLICAMIEQESAWDCWAIRYEPAFMAKYVGPLYTNHKINATEAYARSFSWGVLQTMGQVAREAGFKGPLPQLCDFTIGVTWGCRVWKKKLESAGGDTAKGLLAWNGGARAEYANEVLARIAHYG